MTKLDEAFSKQEIEFSYNGNLGILQEKTKSNLVMVQKLLYLEIISKSDYLDLCKQMKDYFEKQLQLVLNNSCYYLT